MRKVARTRRPSRKFAGSRSIPASRKGTRRATGGHKPQRPKKAAAVRKSPRTPQSEAPAPAPANAPQSITHLREGDQLGNLRGCKLWELQLIRPDGRRMLYHPCRTSNEAEHAIKSHAQHHHADGTLVAVEVQTIAAHRGREILADYSDRRDVLISLKNGMLFTMISGLTPDLADYMARDFNTRNRKRGRIAFTCQTGSAPSHAVTIDQIEKLRQDPAGTERAYWGLVGNADGTSTIVSRSGEGDPIYRVYLVTDSERSLLCETDDKAKAEETAGWCGADGALRAEIVGPIAEEVATEEGCAA